MAGWGVHSRGPPPTMRGTLGPGRKTCPSGHATLEQEVGHGEELQVHPHLAGRETDREKSMPPECHRGRR